LLNLFFTYTPGALVGLAELPRTSPAERPWRTGRAQLVVAA
jgi:hypothetical protein